MNKIKIRPNIYGTGCTFTSEDNEIYVFTLGDEVEKSTQSIISKNDRVSLALAATITALSFYDDAKKAVVAAGSLHSQVKNYLEDPPRSRLEVGEAHREIERMEQEIQTLRARLSAGETAQGPAREPVCSVFATPMQEEPALSPESGSLERPEGSESPFEEEQPEGNRPAVSAVPNVHTGHHSHPASTQVPGELDHNSFMSFFEKKETN